MATTSAVLRNCIYHPSSVSFLSKKQKFCPDDGRSENNNLYHYFELSAPLICPSVMGWITKEKQKKLKKKHQTCK